jgi:hypothetical protein
MARGHFECIEHGFILSVEGSIVQVLWNGRNTDCDSCNRAVANALDLAMGVGTSEPLGGPVLGQQVVDAIWDLKANITPARCHRIYVDGYHHAIDEAIDVAGKLLVTLVEPKGLSEVLNELIDHLPGSMTDHIAMKRLRDAILAYRTTGE